jgi:hypothetical protein
MRLLQQVMCQRHKHVVLTSPYFVRSEAGQSQTRILHGQTNDESVGNVRKKYLWRLHLCPHLDATGWTVSDRGDSHYIQRPRLILPTKGGHSS